MKPSRKALAVFLSFIIVFSACAGMGASAFAAAAVLGSGTCGKDGDNLTWTLTDDGVLTISGNGEMADYLGSHFVSASDIIFESAPWEECRDRVLAAQLGFDSMEEARAALINGEPIDLAAYTAAVRENLTFFKRVVIEEGVTSIGGRALDGMYLTSVSMELASANIFGKYCRVTLALTTEPPESEDHITVNGISVELSSYDVSYSYERESFEMYDYSTYSIEKGRRCHISYTTKPLTNTQANGLIAAFRGSPVQTVSADYSGYMSVDSCSKSAQVVDGETKYTFSVSCTAVSMDTGTVST